MERGLRNLERLREDVSACGGIIERSLAFICFCLWVVGDVCLLLEASSKDLRSSKFGFLRDVCYYRNFVEDFAEFCY